MFLFWCLINPISVWTGAGLEIMLLWLSLNKNLLVLHTAGGLQNPVESQQNFSTIAKLSDLKICKTLG